MLDKVILGLELKIWLIIVAAVIAVICLVVVIILLKKRKPKEKHVKVDDPFINNLISLLGEKDNILEVTVDNGRLKFKVADLDKVQLEGIKGVATSGVFVTGNIIKTLFKLDSQTIKKELDKKL